MITYKFDWLGKEYENHIIAVICARNIFIPTAKNGMIFDNKKHFLRKRLHGLKILQFFFIKNHLRRIFSHFRVFFGRFFSILKKINFHFYKTNKKNLILWAWNKVRRLRANHFLYYCWAVGASARPVKTIPIYWKPFNGECVSSIFFCKNRIAIY